MKRVVEGFSSEHPSNSREYQLAYQRARRQTVTGRLQMAKTNLKVLYGLTFEQYEELFERQRGVCAICSKAIVRAYNIESSGKRGPKRHGAHVDHDHGCCPSKRACGRCIRGLLCSHCNQGLGQFRDKPELLRLALEYVTRPRQYIK